MDSGASVIARVFASKFDRGQMAEVRPIPFYWAWRTLVRRQPGDNHIVMDNYATHKTPKVKAWLARRPHYHAHFTPTSASWINQVERWFAELARKRLRRGVYTSVRQLEADIRAFIDRHNQNPRPFKWTKIC